MSDSEELERAKQHLMKLQNAANQPLLSKVFETEHVRILIDEKISPAMFKPHASLVNTYYANSLTTRAVKKDLFLGGDGFQDLEKLLPCLVCDREIDAQFWKFCPYCEGKLSE